MTDLILHNANVITMNPRMPCADAVAIKNGRIEAVIENEHIQTADTRNANIIDCHGQTVLPGFIDSHCHFRAYAESMMTMDLRPDSGVNSIRDIQSRILDRARVSQSGNWIRGQGYHEFDLLEKRHPTRWELDSVSPNHPVRIAHRTGHAHVLNSMALRLVGLSRYTPDPDGGLMERDLKTGEPTGVLYEMGDLLAERMPSLSLKEMERGIEAANLSFISHGITSLCDASSRNKLEHWENLVEWKNKGVILPRIDMFFSPSVMEEIEGFSSRINKTHIRALGVKIILDETSGEMFPNQDDLDHMVMDVHQLGLQLAIHSVEESAIESACFALEKALTAVPRVDHRHRLEHCFICPESIMDNISSLGAYVVTQPAFIYQNGDRYLATVPEKKKAHLYPIHSLMKRGIMIAAGSDCPVGPIDPFQGIYGAVTRGTQNGMFVNKNESIDLFDSLKLFTYNAACTVFEEDFKGSIEVGKTADLILLSHNLLDEDIESLKETCVDMTIIDGNIVWDNRT